MRACRNLARLKGVFVRGHGRSSGKKSLVKIDVGVSKNWDTPKWMV